MSDYGFFPPAETRCKSGSGFDIRDELRDELNNLRVEFGGPLFVNSGARSVEYNKLVGGAPNSLHTYGLAADIRWPVGSANRYRLLMDACELGFTGIGFYETFIHLDLRHIVGMQPSLWVG